MHLWGWLGAVDDSKLWFNDSLVWISSQVDDKAWLSSRFTRCTVQSRRAT